MKTNWHRTEDLKRFMSHFEFQHYHPDDPRHTPTWRRLKKNCIEGVWFENYGGWQFGPGRLGFYGKFAHIELTNKREKNRYFGAPDVRDLEWERAYMYLEAEGFSGWTEDDKYTSFSDITKLPHPKKMSQKELKEFKDLITMDGKFKEFIDPRENIKMRHDTPKGTALYDNPAKNIIELGSRGGGKSYWYALGGALYRIVFDGIKYYTQENRLNPPAVTVLVGSGKTDKSSEFCIKIKNAMDMLGTKEELGARGKSGQHDYTPSPFFKDMKGSINPNNKDNAWRHEYEMNINGRWQGGFGTKSKLFHVTYSSQKRDGAESGAGGRYTDVYYEEIGLIEKLIEAYNSNKATVRTGVTQFGVQAFLGTSGNMETILPARKMMLHPRDYQILEYRDDYDGTDTPVGFFLPSYMTMGEFKDENGNTNVEKALAYAQERYDIAASSSDPSVLRVHRMNYPSKISDMWQSDKGTLLPSQEAEERERILFRNNHYENIGKSITLKWSAEGEWNGVDYNIDHEAEPFFEFPIESNQIRKSLKGSIQIYDFLIKVRGVVPNDMYILTHDPYVSDDWEDGASLGVSHMWVAPKYWHLITNSPLVATYIGKPKGGKKEYYQNLEKLMHFYGNPPQGLWYEANRGEFCRGFFVKKKKTNLLSLRPQYEKGDKTQQKSITQYGFIVGNKHAKIPMIDDLADLLLEEIQLADRKVRFIETLPCIFSVRQIKHYDIDGNFDAISSMLGYPLYIREEEHKLLYQSKLKKLQKNPLSFFANNLKMGLALRNKITTVQERDWYQEGLELSLNNNNEK